MAVGNCGCNQSTPVVNLIPSNNTRYLDPAMFKGKVIGDFLNYICLLEVGCTPPYCYLMESINLILWLSQGLRTPHTFNSSYNSSYN